MTRKYRFLFPRTVAGLAAAAALLLLLSCDTPSQVSQVPDTPAVQGKTALDRYVAEPDAAYRYEVVQNMEDDGVKASLVRMISQRWLSEDIVDRPEWEHYLYIYRPQTVKYTTGFLFITGGANDGKVPKPSRDMAGIAKATGSVVTELRNVPNQPLVFKGDDFGPREEDEILSYAWRKYLETEDEKWIGRLPMTKAAVRAMDTVTDFMKSEKGGTVTVDKFVVAGASKRGWTTWTTTAADPRVVAAVPIVIDLLNVEKSFVYHYRKYGFWAPAVGDYFREGMMDRMADPRYRKLMSIVDPYAYRERCTMPMYIVNASGDQFFRPESSRFYFKDLPGEKHLRYVPNAGHNVGKGTDALATVVAFYQSILEDAPRPEMKWTVEADGSLRVTADRKPKAVRLWAGNNPKYNDFRIDSAGPIFQSTELHPVSENTWLAKPPAVASGFTAYFVEMEWEGPGAYPIKFSTEVLVTPETFPSGPPVPGQTKLGPEKQE